MEQILASGKADIIYMGRQLVCDPDFPNKVRRGCVDEIRKCIRCLACFSEGVRHGDLICAINPEIGREREVYRALPKPEKQRVLVIGGGVIGSQLAGRGSRTTGTLLGAGGGAVIGQRLSERLGIPFIDREILRLVSERLHLEEYEVEREQLEADVLRLTGELLERGLVVQA